MSLIELNCELANGIEGILVRKVDWTIQLLSSDESRPLVLMDKDGRLLVGSHKGIYAIISLLEKILEQFNLQFNLQWETDVHLFYKLKKKH